LGWKPLVAGVSMMVVMVMGVLLSREKASTPIVAPAAPARRNLQFRNMGTLVSVLICCVNFLFEPRVGVEPRAPLIVCHSLGN